MPPFYRFDNQREIDRAQKRTREGQWALNALEIPWRERFEFLKGKGYLLRPRFHPDWAPSWLDTDLKPLYCEDAQILPPFKVIDAKRVSDDSTVVLKPVLAGGTELQITKFLSDLSDAQNHSMPLLDDFPDESDETKHYMVTPLLFDFDTPAFHSVDEVVDFVHQTLEGLLFIHRQNVAHRDLSLGNIMMEAKGLYPKGFHPTAQNLTPDCRHFTKPIRRRDAPVLKYYIIDFGISTRFEGTDVPRLVTGEAAQDRDVPDLSSTIPYDPFLVDIFTLGNVYRKAFLRKYSNVDFLRPLVEAMTKATPADRPSAEQAFEQFRQIIKERRFSMYKRLHAHDDSNVTIIWKDIASNIDSVVQVFKSLVGRRRRRILALEEGN